MSTFAVVRHTRQNEETGRAELIGASVVGRDALLTAAMVTVILANAVLGALNAATLAAFGLPMEGCLAAGATIAAGGVAFGAVAAVMAQIATTARAANGLAGAALGVAFALRGYGDMFSSVDDTGVRVISAWPSWLSPLGWGQQVRPFDDNAWAVLGLLIVFTATLTTMAFGLLAHRDLGSGMLPSRPGPPEGRPALLHPLGLAWRLQRNVLLAWAAAMLILGVAYGAMAPEVEDLVGSSDATRELLEQFGGTGLLVDVYLSATIAMAGIGVAAYTVQATLRVRHEETEGMIEGTLATAVSRSRWLFTHVLIAAAGTMLLLVLIGGATGLAYGVTIDDPLGQLARYAWAGFLWTPAALVLGGVAVLAFGLLPGASRAVAWTVYAACLVLGQLGELFGLPDLVLDLSPYTHLAAVPVEPARFLPFATLCAAAAGLAALGAVAFRRRDIAVA
jgi:ABC-2 type transport system permease protein